MISSHLVMIVVGSCQNGLRRVRMCSIEKHLNSLVHQNEAHPRTSGFLLGTVHRKIERRPDILEAVIFDGDQTTQRTAARRLLRF